MQSVKQRSWALLSVVCSGKDVSSFIGETDKSRTESSNTLLGSKDAIKFHQQNCAYYHQYTELEVILNFHNVLSLLDISL